MQDFNGGCRCGNVRFTASGSPIRVGICHCLDCRKQHGALFYAAAIFPQDAVDIKGTTNSYKGRHFCPQCGAPVFAKTDDEVELHLGSLDEANQLIPTYESWCTHRQTWLPKFEHTTKYQHERTDIVQIAEPQKTSITQIRPMREAEFNIWLPHCINEYAKEKSTVMQISQDQAMQLSEQSFAKGLPEGLATANNHLFSILNQTGEVIGDIWFTISTQWGTTTAFIYDLEIAPKFRGMGHAANAMRLIEPEAKKLGANKLALHVFGFNHAATSLYKKLGYHTTDISMAKPI